MKALLLNRISLLLAFAGIFVAGTLSLAHWLRQDVPCGADGGCAEITKSPQAFDPIFNQPVAYYGLLAYLFLTTMAVMRSANGMKGVRGPILMGTIVSFLGTAASAYLTYSALFVIRATCYWCLSSAAIMLVTFIVHLLMMRAPEPETEASDFDFKLMLGLGVITAIALVGSKGFFDQNPLLSPQVIGQDKLASLTTAEIAPEGRAIDGVVSAPVTIVEFGDLTCGYCRKVFPEVKEIVANSKGKIRLMFRHLPLYEMKDHENSLYAAFLAELAAEKGKLFDFLAGIFSFEEKLETNEMLQVATQVGIDPEVVKKRFDSKDDPAWERVTQDLTFAQSILKVQSTPVFIVYANGVKELKEARSIEALRMLLDSAAIKEVLNKP
ncbi:MAG: vitamin K epoxide reductase family protein [Fimbriimonadaceae bacterium]